MAAYYNEIDGFAAAWLRELIKAGLIADGEVDERSIADVTADDVRGFTQCHFFAGIGGWSYALRLAGWSDDRAVWTGSCPCQPWSSAGAGLEASDPRDLWPAWFKLVRECEPSIVFGEQVAGKAGRAWLDRVYDDLEACGYAFGPFDIPACSVGAFHKRQRHFFVADSGYAHRGQDGWRRFSLAGQHALQSEGAKAASQLGNDRQIGWMADPNGRQSGDAPIQRSRQHGQRPADGAVAWKDPEWIACADGKARPIEPGLEPLAHGLPARLGRLRGYGNAIVPQVAAAFIEAYMSIGDSEAMSTIKSAAKAPEPATR